MDNEVYYLMSQKQLNRYLVITKLIDGHITVKETSKSLGLCERQILRLKKGVQQQGASFLVHKNKGKKPQHAIPDQTAQTIINLKKSDTYKDANFLHFQEMLAEYEQISISYSALYNLLKKSGFESPKKRRRFKPHRTRKRRPQEGLLIQMDATPYDWFGTGEKFSLHGGIDDGLTP
jgi:transposase